MRYFQPGIPQKSYYRAPFFCADSERVATTYHSVLLGNLPALLGRTAMREAVTRASWLIGSIIP